ncbi:hypothetical protein ACIBL5_04550 [Streptomyces sp. NPDC050516]|uniref:hypothetical protein n=1 Tax=Streptomyces sp. NPDC050516 TaxID=3365621 RepID=UPI00379DE959
MDSRISNGPGGQPRPGHPVGDQPPRDQTMQLGAFAEELTTPTRRLTKPDPRLAKPEPKAVRTDPRLVKPDPRLARPEPHATAPTQQLANPEPEPDPEPDPEPVSRSMTQKIPIFKPLRAASAEQAVFVDVSGKRGKKLRWLGWLFGLAATGFAVALVGSLLGGSARAPGLNLPDKADAVTAPPKATASGVPQPKASPSKKAVVPVHSASKAPSPKSSKSSHSATPVTGHSPVDTKVPPRPGTSHKPVTRAASPSAGKTGA